MNAGALLHTGWRLARRGVWHAGRPRRGLLPLVLSLIVAAAFATTFTALFHALALARAPVAIADRALGWAFTFAFLLLTLGDALSAVSAAATDRDLERFLAAPLRPRELLAVKFAQTLPRTLGPLLVIALPAAAGLAWAHGGVNVVAVVVALVALWAVPLGLGSAIALPLLGLAPAARLRESLAVLATVAFVAGWLANTFWMPRLVAVTDWAGGLRAIPPPPAWSPATWAAEAITAPGIRAVEAIARCVLAAVGSLALAVVSAERLLAELPFRAVFTAGHLVRGSSRRARTLAGAFLRRDLALFSRDWPVLLDLLSRLALWSLLPLAVLPLAPLPHQVLARDMLIALTLSLGNDVAARALPLERTSLAWARLSPVGGARWVRRRALGVGLLGVSILVATSLVVGVGLRLSPAGVVDAFAFALAAAASAMAAGLLVGAALGDPEWRDPRAMLGIGGRTVSAGVMLTQGTLWIALAHAADPRPVDIGWLAALCALGAVVAWPLLALTARIVERREFSAR
jgi:ABC-2 type transport system permease protein